MAMFQLLQNKNGGFKNEKANGKIEGLQHRKAKQ